MRKGALRQPASTSTETQGRRVPGLTPQSPAAQAVINMAHAAPYAVKISRPPSPVAAPREWPSTATRHIRDGRLLARAGGKNGETTVGASIESDDSMYGHSERMKLRRRCGAERAKGGQRRAEERR